MGGPMAASSPWSIIHAEREALADDLAGLNEAQWSSPSLLPRWSVRDVLAHMTATAKTTPAAFFSRLAATGFRFNEMAEKNIARENTGTPADLLAEFRRHSGEHSPAGAGRHMAGRDHRAQRGHPPAARHHACLPDGSGHAGGRLLQAIQPADRQ